MSQTRNVLTLAIFFCKLKKSGAGKGQAAHSANHLPRKDESAMPFVPAPDVCLAELVMQLDGQVVENTLYFEASAGLDLSLMASLGAALVTWWTDFIAPGVTEQLLLTGVNLTDLTTAISPGVFVPVVPAVPGEGTSPAEPNNVSLCVSFRTAFRGRSARGRNYVVGLQNSQVTNSHVDAGVADFFITAYQQLQGAGDFVAGLEWGVLSRFSGGDPRTTALFRPIIAVTVVDNTLDSQRRRLPGRGA